MVDLLLFAVFFRESIKQTKPSNTAAPGSARNDGARGTPADVGVARKPPRFMEAGDVVRVEISGLGVLKNPVIDKP